MAFLTSVPTWVRSVTSSGHWPAGVYGSGPPDGQGRRLKSFLIAAADHHRGPFRGKLPGYGQTNTGGSSGDQGHFFLELHAVPFAYR